MLNRIQTWLKARKEQRLWEQSEREEAYRLLGMYKALSVQISRLSPEDKSNVLDIIRDPKYLSVLKLQDNLKATWLQNLHRGKIPDPLKEMYKGGVQMLELVEHAISNELQQNHIRMTEQQQVAKILDGLGWNP